MTELQKGEKLAELEAIRAFEVEPERARERLQELLRDGEDDVRAEAAGSVWEFADAAFLVERVLELTTGDPSPAVRAKALGALGRVVYEGDVAGADEAAYKPDPLLGEPSAELFAKVRDHLLAVAGEEKRTLDERRFALESLGFLGADPRVVALVEAFWARPEPAARLSAVFAMGRSGDGRWAPRIEEALGSPDSELRLQAIWAAGEAEVAGARSRLIELARACPARDERTAAIESLGRLGGEAARSALLDVAEHDSSVEVREVAAGALEEMALLDTIDEGEDERDEPK